MADKREESNNVRRSAAPKFHLHAENVLPQSRFNSLLLFNCLKPPMTPSVMKLLGHVAIPPVKFVLRYTRLTTSLDLLLGLALISAHIRSAAPTDEHTQPSAPERSSKIKLIER